MIENQKAQSIQNTRQTRGIFLMTKAQIQLVDGTKIEIEGDAASIAAVIVHISGGTSGVAPKKRAVSVSAPVSAPASTEFYDLPKRRARRKNRKPKKSRGATLLEVLNEEGFFKTAHTMTEIVEELRSRGKHFNGQQLFPVLRSMAKNGAIVRGDKFYGGPM